MRAIGVIETRGLAAAVEAADAGVKSADVELLGYELSRGAGQVTVKLEGDISAVTAAVEAGAHAASKVNQVVATLIMGRPHEEIQPLIYSPDMIGLLKKETVEEPAAEALQPDACSEGMPDLAGDRSEGVLNQGEEEDSEQPVEPEQEENSEQLVEPEQEATAETTCNLCHDPACPRRKGEPHINCIHYRDDQR